MRLGKTKIAIRAELADIVRAAKQQGKTVGFTSGVFDLVHRGHTKYLEEARSKCDLLVVGVNSDSSVKAIKGPLRPIRLEDDRAALISGIESVDFVFLFDDTNNNENVKLLQPNIYFKAGDYDESKLTSAKIVKEYGGTVIIVPLDKGLSTTSLIKKVLDLHQGVLGVYEELPPPKPAPAIFVDRDGTINEHVPYLHEPGQFKLIPGVLEALKKAKDAGYRLVIITNQPGIGVGYFTKEDLYMVHRELFKQCTAVGVAFDKIYFCPHSQADGCTCRKPAPGMINRGISELNIIREKSWMIGDMTLDIGAGKAAGCRTILVKTGEGGSDKRFDVTPDHVANSVVDAVDFILKAQG